MKVLVTGGNGFIAKNLIKYLEKNDSYESIYAINRTEGFSSANVKVENRKTTNIFTELTSSDWVEKTLSHIQPDIIFHLAAEQGKTPKAFHNNVLITLNLLKHCPDRCRFVYASSSTVYGDHSKDNNHKCQEDNCPTVPTSLYGASKLAGEALVGAYQNTGKIDSIVLRYVATIGKGATHGVLPDVIKKMKDENNILELFGEFPGSCKPYIHVSDAVKVILYLIENKQNGIYNICPNDNINIHQIASYIRYTFGLDGQKLFKWSGDGTTPPGDNKHVLLDNSKILKTGWKPNYSWSMEAIIKTVNES